MAQQIPMSEHVEVGVELDDGAVELDPTLAYLRLAIVNVVLYGQPRAGDRGWVLVDAGVSGSKAAIERVAAARFGPGARPSAIILTHGHFDHVGALEALAADWDAPVYAHPLEHGYLDGTLSYPPAHPSIQDGLMSLLSPLYPRGPIDLGSRLRPLPADGTVPAMPGWRWIHTPGHTPGHVSLWHEDSRTLIAGDAVITTAQEFGLRGRPAGSGDPRPTPVLHHGLGRCRTVGSGSQRATAEDAGDRPRPTLAGPAMREGLERLAADFKAIAVP